MTLLPTWPHSVICWLIVRVLGDQCLDLLRAEDVGIAREVEDAHLAV